MHSEQLFGAGLVKEESLPACSRAMAEAEACGMLAIAHTGQEWLLIKEKARYGG